MKWIAGVIALALTLTAKPASAASGETIPVSLRTTWPCAPSTVYIDPAAPASVLEVIAEWRRLSRPDWVFTTSQSSATVQILMRRPTLLDADGLANMAADATTRRWAIVEIGPDPSKQHARIARHELGHVAGLEHETQSQYSAMSTYPLVDRYSVRDMIGMRLAAKRCR
jgi:predicted Zn-dependent protease